jgi:hypothetical protein
MAVQFTSNRPTTVYPLSPPVQFTPLYAGMPAAYPQLDPPLGGGLVEPLGLNAVPNRTGSGASPDGKLVRGAKHREWIMASVVALDHCGLCKGHVRVVLLM